jgi:hypothetical protein
MNWHINYLIARQRHLELARSAEQARLKRAHIGSPPSSPRGYARWLLATHRLSATRRAAAARQANPGPPQEPSGATHNCARSTAWRRPTRGCHERKGPGVFTTPFRHRVCADPDPTFIHPGAAPNGNQ